MATLGKQTLERYLLMFDGSIKIDPKKRKVISMTPKASAEDIAAAHLLVREDEQK